MAANGGEPKILNNCLDCARDFLQLEIGRFSAVPKTSVFERAAECRLSYTFRIFAEYAQRKGRRAHPEGGALIIMRQSDTFSLLGVSRWIHFGKHFVPIQLLERVRAVDFCDKAIPLFQ